MKKTIIIAALLLTTGISSTFAATGDKNNLGTADRSIDKNNLDTADRGDKNNLGTADRGDKNNLGTADRF